MVACASCGADGVAPGVACPRCGTKAMPALELDMPKRPPAPHAAPRKKANDQEAPLELAVDPQALVKARSTAAPPSIQALAPIAVPGQAPAPAIAPAQPAAPAAASAPAVGDLSFDARLLADFGDAPRSLLLAPMYAWRVLRRLRELKAALAERRAEAARARGVWEDAMVALAERVRARAEKDPSYAAAFEDLRRAEDLLRSRDRVLAGEQSAQAARLSAVDARLSKLEAELSAARGEEQRIGGELEAARSALARAEAALKRAEAEARAAQQRSSGGGA